MSGISTHVLDTATGRPAAGVAVVLARLDDHGDAHVLSRVETDADGRAKTLLPDGTELRPGDYRLTFHVGAWRRAHGTEGFYPEVVVTFTVFDGGQHHHVPLLLSPFGYSTYRGS